jgi:hypothetical protein
MTRRPAHPHRQLGRHLAGAGAGVAAATPRSRRTALALAAGCAASLAVGGTARARDDVDLALVLAVDCSSSVDDNGYALQRAGYANAFIDPRLGLAVQGGARGAIAVTLMQWAGPYEHVEAVGWQVVRDDASARAFAALIAVMPRRLEAPATSISGAIDNARGLLDREGFEQARRVIDISGDGMNNTGRRPESARDEAIAAGIVINGLPILTTEPTLDDYYADYVIGGSGAFVLPARSLAVFGQAILTKLLREVASTDGQGGVQPSPS